MLTLVHKYGLSHVCASKEFENIENWLGILSDTLNFPHLDIYISDPWSNKQIEFYFRGTNDQALSQRMIFQNLFEYLRSTSMNGPGGINFIISKLLN